MDATGIFTEMKFATMNHPNIKNNIIRMEISPAMEHTENFTLDDWRELWHDFAAAFDMQEIRDKDGKVFPSRQTYRAASHPYGCMRNPTAEYPIFMHRQPDGRKREHQQRPRHTPPRTTGGGNDSPAKGMDYAQHIHETNIPKVSADCMEVLRELDNWSWDGYQERLAAKGYELYLRKDKKDVIRGYVLLKGTRNSRHRNLERDAT